MLRSIKGYAAHAADNRAVCTYRERHHGGVAMCGGWIMTTVGEAMHTTVHEVLVGMALVADVCVHSATVRLRVRRGECGSRDHS